MNISAACSAEPEPAGCGTGDGAVARIVSRSGDWTDTTSQSVAPPTQCELSGKDMRPVAPGDDERCGGGDRGDRSNRERVRSAARAGSSDLLVYARLKWRPAARWRAADRRGSGRTRSRSGERLLRRFGGGLLSGLVNASRRSGVEGLLVVVWPPQPASERGGDQNEREGSGWGHRPGGCRSMNQP